MDAASWDTGHSNSDTESEQQPIDRRDQAIIDAAKNGDVAAVRQWLDDGGNADARITVGPYIPGLDNWIFGGDGEGLLHHILRFHPNNFDDEVKRGRCDVARLLIARGAAVDAVGNWPPEFSTRDTPLFIAALFGHHEMCEVLCAAGADPNYTRLGFESGGVARCPDFPLWVCLTSPATVRVLLRFGADPSRKCRSHFGGDLVTPEEEALRWVNSHYEPGDEADYRESARLLAAPRLLRPRLRSVFALRALCHRGRASPTTETPAAFARLIGGGTPRPRTRAAAKKASPGLPDPLAHLVCKFWLGEPPKNTE